MFLRILSVYKTRKEKGECGNGRAMSRKIEVINKVKYGTDVYVNRNTKLNTSNSSRDSQKNKSNKKTGTRPNTALTKEKSVSNGVRLSLRQQMNPFHV